LTIVGDTREVIFVEAVSVMIDALVDKGGPRISSFPKVIDAPVSLASIFRVDAPGVS